MRLRAWLNHEPGATPPEEWIVGIVCEEFRCLPRQAIRELDEGDADLVFAILEMRNYVRAKHVVDNAKSQSDLNMSDPAIRRVFEIEIAARSAKG